MCGIVGYIGPRNPVEVTISGLRRLEYRGYDSAGLATLSEAGIEIRRSVGRIDNLAQAVEDAPVATSFASIGHTRWATHGKPTIDNAHPHKSGRVAIVHNGIIENHEELRQQLTRQGFIFRSETDSEVVAHLIEHFLESGMDPFFAVKETVRKLEGAFALCVLIEGFTNVVYVAKKASPLALGLGEAETFIGSDAFALAPYTRQIVYLLDGDVAEVCAGGIAIFDANDNPVDREMTTSQILVEDEGKQNHAHYMAKEIHEQPGVIRRIISHAVGEDGLPLPIELPVPAGDIARVSFVGCGTAHYATLVARYWFGEWAGLETDVEVASEFRYRGPPLRGDTLGILVSQSGETADTLAALEFFKERGCPTVGIVNAPESSIARGVDLNIPTRAGVEVSVASTKAFTAQLTTLALLAISLGLQRGHLSPARARELVSELNRTPHLIELALHKEDVCRRLAEELTTQWGPPVYLGRGSMFALALEGALKIKEISYLKAEGFAAGELKHGPLALMDEKVPAIFVVPDDGLKGKTLSNLREVAARGAHVIAVCEEGVAAEIEIELGSSTPCSFVLMPESTPASVAPIVFVVALQLIAYHAAVHLGYDVDKPRNLAKSVTVE